MTEPDTAAVAAVNLTRRYGRQSPVDGVSFAIVPGTITGLLGRNGSGKSTLMRIIAAQEFATSGSVSVFGRPPAENAAVQHRMALIREDQVYPDFRVRHALAAASWCYPNWNAALAQQLVEDFELPTDRQIKKLSRGMRSAVGIVIGLACRAELTLLDEPYAGLDPVARRIFYDRLLQDYAVHPRTVMLSTHLVDEVADLLEHVLLIDRGRITLDAPVDEVRGSAVTVSGPRAAVQELIGGRTVWHTNSLGSRLEATVAGALSDLDRARARNLGIEIAPLSLQQLLVHVVGTGRERASA